MLLCHKGESLSNICGLFLERRSATRIKRYMPVQHLLCYAWPPIRLQARMHNMDRHLAACGGKRCADLVRRAT